eukprot:COSAG02_NODE_29513_length_567_cov_154.256410_2_plen_60_part_01
MQVFTTGQPVAAPQPLHVHWYSPLLNMRKEELQLSGHWFVSPVIAQPLSPQTPLSSAHVH